jgi:hypothetical protein
VYYYCLNDGSFSKLLFSPCRFSLRYFGNNPSPFHGMTVYSVATSLSKKRKFSSKKTSDAVIVTDLETVQSCYSFLRVSSDYFRQCWNWSDFIKMYVGHKDNFICW